jgi:hypothetical protein
VSTDVSSTYRFHFLWIYTQLWDYWVVWKFYPTVVLLLTFAGTSILSSTMAKLNLHSHQQCKSALFSTSSPALAVFCLFDNSYSNSCGHHLIVELLCIFLMTLSIFSYTCWPSVCLLLRNVYRVLCLLFVFCLLFHCNAFFFTI